MDIHHILVDIQSTLKILKTTEESADITNFKKQKQEGARFMLKGALQRLLDATKYTDSHELALRLSAAPISDMPIYLEKLAHIAAQEPHIPASHPLKIPRLPSDIKDEITADLHEIDACMKAGCFRSAVILCGRVMETALHRKYFDATGVDLLEKAPGTGLGNLIAKLAEKGVGLDPGLPNQIHLINQVRVFSVHTKKDPFRPSKTQAEAIRLYTIDILDKLFA